LTVAWAVLASLPNPLGKLSPVCYAERMASTPKIRIAFTPAEYVRLCRIVRDWQLTPGKRANAVMSSLADRLNAAGERFGQDRLPDDPFFDHS
jgi:hypothetical protein